MGRQHLTKIRAGIVLTVAANRLAAHGRPRKPPNKPRPARAGTKASTVATIDEFRKGWGIAVVETAYEAIVAVVEKDYPHSVAVYGSAGLTPRQIVARLDSEMWYDNREVVRYATRAARALRA